MRINFIYCCLLFLGLNVAHAANEAAYSALAQRADVPACMLTDTHEIESVVGTPAFVTKAVGGAGEEGFCLWTGSQPDASVKVSYFPRSETDGEDAAPRESFMRLVEEVKRRHEPGEFIAVPELADDAWAVDPSNNPEQYFEVYLLKGGDQFIVATRRIGLEATVTLARHISSRE